jgi:hypothetical protein
MLSPFQPLTLEGEVLFRDSFVDYKIHSYRQRDVENHRAVPLLNEWCRRRRIGKTARAIQSNRNEKFAWTNLRTEPPTRFTGNFIRIEKSSAHLINPPTMSITECAIIPGLKLRRK